MLILEMKLLMNIQLIVILSSIYSYVSKTKHNSDNFLLPSFADNLILTDDHKTVKLADFGLAREESLTDDDC